MLLLLIFFIIVIFILLFLSVAALLDKGKGHDGSPVLSWV
jgi:hypothetical protein